MQHFACVLGFESFNLSSWLNVFVVQLHPTSSHEAAVRNSKGWASWRCACIKRETARISPNLRTIFCIQSLPEATFTDSPRFSWFEITFDVSKVLSKNKFNRLYDFRVFRDARYKSNNLQCDYPLPWPQLCSYVNFNLLQTVMGFFRHSDTPAGHATGNWMLRVQPFSHSQIPDRDGMMQLSVAIDCTAA